MDEHWKKENINLKLSAITYIQNVIPKFEKLLGKNFKKSKIPMSQNYHLEIDDFPILNSEKTFQYRKIIKSLN